MSDPAPVPGPEVAAAEAQPPRPGFAFTDPGCRTEIRLGALMILVGVFLWGWMGPTWASPIAYLGLPLVLVGIPLQIRDNRRDGRPGYPWKLGLALGLGGLLMSFDLVYRERHDEALKLPLTTILLLIPGAVILAGWPFARRRPPVEAAP